MHFLKIIRKLLYFVKIATKLHYDNKSRDIPTFPNYCVIMYSIVFMIFNYKLQGKRKKEKKNERRKVSLYKSITSINCVSLQFILHLLYTWT